VCRITQEHPRVPSDFGYGGFTLCAGAFHLPHLSSGNPTAGSYNPGSKLPVWALPLSLATTDGIDSLSFPPVTEMFHFTGYRALFPIFYFGKRRWNINSTGLPHSEISGSKRICRSPKLIAAYHVLHRLLAPRHPLCALKSLIPCLKPAVNRKEAGLAPAFFHNPPTSPPASCRKKFCIWEFRIYSRTARTARGTLTAPLVQSLCSQSNHISLHTDVKERTLMVCAETTFCPGKMVGLVGLEPTTPALSRRCSNQLSYRPLAGLRPAI
jgi:hypothetical protein